MAKCCQSAGWTKGNTAFQFNTYIIAVLVIFFLQMNYELPVAKDITILVASGHQKSAKSTLDEMKSFDKTVD